MAKALQPIKVGQKLKLLKMNQLTLQPEDPVKNIS